MKKLIIVLFIILTTPTLAIDVPTTLNKVKIQSLASNYIKLIQKTINESSNDFYAKNVDYFEDPLINEHIYDLRKLDLEMEEINNYFLDAKNSKNIQKVDINFESIKIYDCIYSDLKTSKNYSYVKITKDFYWIDSAKKNTVNHLLEINITNSSSYKITNVYELNEINKEFYVNKCLSNSTNAKQLQKIAIRNDNLYEEIEILYSKMEYLKALQIVDDILKSNNQYQKAVDAKEAILYLIKFSYLKDKIVEAISNNKFNDANKILKISKEHKIGTTKEFNEINILVKKAREKKEQEQIFKKAEYFFNLEMYANALPIYNSLKIKGFDNNLLENRIYTCKEADPNLIKKRITTAYNRAVSSKKHYKNTFKTYYKYENSGYLTGSNFRFMCLLMVGKGNKSLLKEMSISKNQAKNMAINYFYKAKENGVDMRDIEFIVFTRNFNKQQKK